MPLSPKQTARYWREWKAVCIAQGWSSSDSMERYNLHIAAGLPKSMKEFGNRHFDAFLSHCEGLKNRVDIRDRERERIEVTIARLDAAIQVATGKSYARGILADMHDASDHYDLPVDPWDEQYARGGIRTWKEKDEEGKTIIHNGTLEADLSNLRDTLKNRLSKILTKIKSGKLPCPEGCEWWTGAANNPTITAIASNKIAVKIRGGYAYLTPPEYRDLQRGCTAPAAGPQNTTETPDFSNEELCPF